MEKNPKKRERKKLERKSKKKKIIIKPLTRPKPNANRKAQYKINLISNQDYHYSNTNTIMFSIQQILKINK